MKSSFVICALLLLVPVALAKLPDSILSRYIFDRRFVLAESSQGFVNYEYDASWYLNFHFLSSKDYLSINIYNYRRPLDAFVVELLDRVPGRGAVHDCRNDSVAWLQDRIFKCHGYLRVRNLTEEEHNQMESFMDNFEVKRQSFHAVFDKGYIATKVAGGNRIFIDAANDEYMATVQAKTTYGDQFAHIYFYDDKSFVMEQARKPYDCKAPINPPIGDLSVSKVFCKGDFQIRSMDEEDRP